MLSPELPPETPRTPKVLDFSRMPCQTNLPEDDESHKSSEPDHSAGPGDGPDSVEPVAHSAADRKPSSSSSSSESASRQRRKRSTSAGKSKSPAAAREASESPPPENILLLNKQIDDLRLNFRKKCEQIKALRNAIKVYKNSVDDKTTYHAELEKQLALFQERLIDRNEELHARTNELKDVKEKNTVLLASGGGGENAEGMHKLASELAAKDEKIQQLTHCEKAVERLQTVKQLLEQELASTGEQNKKLKARMADMRYKLEQLRTGKELSAYVQAQDLQVQFLQAALAGDDGLSDLEAEICSAAEKEPRLKNLSSLLPQVRSRLQAGLEENSCQPSQI